jgi:hypothetical protein
MGVQNQQIRSGGQVYVLRRIDFWKSRGMRAIVPGGADSVPKLIRSSI